jgi:methionine sulfoxide reductase heme-binding subunit
VTSHLAWYTARASGFTALVLLTASMAIGLALSLKLRSPGWPRFLTTELHRFTTLTALVFIGVHTAALYADSYVGFGVADLLVPFASSYAPLGMALGITASYLLVAVWASSQLQRRIGWTLWRALHYVTFALYVLAVAHTLAMGDDTTTAWGIATVAGSVVLVGGLTALRALAAGRTAPTLPRQSHHRPRRT